MEAVERRRSTETAFDSLDAKGKRGEGLLANRIVLVYGVIGRGVWWTRSDLGWCEELLFPHFFVFERNKKSINPTLC